MTIDGRLKTLRYHPHVVYKFTGYYYFQTIIEFEEGETISTISMGSPQGWSISNSGNRLFIKPVSLTPEDSLTNMTLISNKRMYFFEMHADEVEDVTSQEIPFIISFIYPEIDNSAKVIQIENNNPINVTDNKYLNYNYTLSGDATVAPTQIFDDGLFTYFKFDSTQPIPAFFEVGRDGYEGIINYRVEGKNEEEYIVIESIVSQFTLRYGDQIACVFNENKPLDVIVQERKTLFSPAE
ncbi:MAG: TrbG/VirB9 family P-type conjugative transfer protein [Pseudomonadota bacterium]